MKLCKKKKKVSFNVLGLFFFLTKFLRHFSWGIIFLGGEGEQSQR